MRITRESAIERLRHVLAANTPEGQCTCRYAAERNVFCRGFHRDAQTEIRMRYAAVIDVSGLRTAVEERANEYQLRRAREEGGAVSCDVQQRSYETCCGWDDFTNEQLGQFCFELIGERVRVVGSRNFQ